jgi:hypothetical protein
MGHKRHIQTALPACALLPCHPPRQPTFKPSTPCFHLRTRLARTIIVDRIVCQGLGSRCRLVPNTNELRMYVVFANKNALTLPRRETVCSYLRFRDSVTRRGPKYSGFRWTIFANGTNTCRRLLPVLYFRTFGLIVFSAHAFEIRSQKDESSSIRKIET